MSRKIKSKVPLIMIVIILPLLFLADTFMSKQPRYYINLSPSEPRGLYKVEAFHGSLQTGDMVIFDVPEQVRPYVYGRDWVPADRPLLKHVGAIPGDVFCVTDTAAYINGGYLGPVSMVDSKGRPMPVLRGSYQIEEGYFFPVATMQARSFDGRYFGAVPTNLIRNKVIPVITF